MASFAKFEPFIEYYSREVVHAVNRDGCSSETFIALYRRFVGELVPFDDSAVHCQAGCGTCCHLRVSTSLAEVAVLAAVLEARGEGEGWRRRIEAADPAPLQRAGREEDWWRRQRVSCLFLDQESFCCSIYDLRPFACRGYHSLDVGLCRRAYAEGVAMEIPCYPDLKRSRELFTLGFARGLAALGLQAELVELSSAAALFLCRPECLARWLRGEEVLDSSGSFLP